MLDKLVSLPRTLLAKLLSGHNVVTRAEADRIYHALLRRPLEAERDLPSVDSIDFCISVAQSDEYARMAEEQLYPKVQNHLQSSQELWISRSRHDSYWVTHTRDNVIGEALRLTGRFQEDLVGHCADFLDQNGVNAKKGAFLDIGSNIGTHAIYALNNGFEAAICFEPDTDNFKLLRINQILHGVDDRCQNHQMALSNAKGVVAMECSPDNFGDHRVRPDKSGAEPQTLYGENDWSQRSVSVTSLDVLCQQGSIDPNEIGLAWLDTQGHEGHVLDGATQLVKAGVPIVAEFWPYGLHRSGGYQLFRDVLDAADRIFDVRASENRNSITEVEIGVVDTMFEEFMDAEEGSHAAHTDLLILQR